MAKYDHKKIEKKWQERWRESGLYKAVEDPARPKSYVLDMFPYPSGDGLHVGHPKGYIATDIYSRRMRMAGHTVLHPMGWDAFGLPAENYALKNKVHPRLAVEKNIARYKEQLSGIGFDYDWEREINTTDPSYYKWTQWIFLQLFKKGLAYQSDEPINWCPSCKTGLANEDLEKDGTCERCGTPVEKKSLPQWVLKITDYADRLLEDLDTLDGWPEHIKESQRNWIGRSEGAELDFQLSTGDTVTVFTTRPDTLFGATYMVLAPEHPLVAKMKEDIKNYDEVVRYAEGAGQKSEIERTAEGKEKTGVELKGIKAINPATKEEIPVFIADYVLAHYGTGAIMAVPAHDERDHAFAQKFGLPVKPVVMSSDQEIFHTKNFKLESNEKFILSALTASLAEAPTMALGVLINSGQFDGLSSEEAKRAITEAVGGRMTTTYKLRDWVFSRQRYWGEPIPVIHCGTCGAVPVPEEDLPVVLPEVEHYEPSGTGESPLATIEAWVNTTCPKCGGTGRRETNTMPQWAGSSWYYLRYMDAHNDDALVSPENEKYWAPVDMYVGGAEHATRHLIYARFWHKFLHDIGVVSTVEPFAKLHSVGLIIAEDGKKMSKRFGNVINPDDIVATYGADTLRVYEMFMGPFENAIAWNTSNVMGARRFLERVWKLSESVAAEEVAALDAPLHQTIKKVGYDIEAFKFNTAISAMMIFLNAAEKEGSIGKEQWAAFLQILAPFAPHMAEELWEKTEQTSSIHASAWPAYDSAKAQAETVTIAVQINGRVRGTFSTAADSSEEELKREALAMPMTKKWMAGQEAKKVIVIPNKLVNIVV